MRARRAAALATAATALLALLAATSAPAVYAQETGSAEESKPAPKKRKVQKARKVKEEPVSDADLPDPAEVLAEAVSTGAVPVQATEEAADAAVEVLEPAAEVPAAEAAPAAAPAAEAAAEAASEAPEAASPAPSAMLEKLVTQALDLGVDVGGVLAQPLGEEPPAVQEPEKAGGEPEARASRRLLGVPELLRGVFSGGTGAAPAPAEEEAAEVNGTAEEEEEEGGAEAGRRRQLLAMSVSGGNTKWVAWDETPVRFAEQRTGPEVQVARQSGYAHIDRPGGFWTAARINTQVTERAQRSRLPADFGARGGEGTLDGPYAGINQHDRVGMNKASKYPGLLHKQKRCPGSHCKGELEVSLDPYPALGTIDRVHFQVQPFVVGVTSYSPNIRSQNYQYRNMFRVAGLVCANGAARCQDATVVTVGMHSLKAGDRFYFQGVLGSSRSKLNNMEFVVDTDATAHNFSASPSATVNTLTDSPQFDLSSAVIIKSRTVTAANANPPFGEHDWAYEEGDKVYFFVTFSEPVVVTGSPRLLLDTGSHYEAGAADAYATFVGGGFGEKKSFWKNNERNPIKAVGDSKSWFDDVYHVHDNGCTLQVQADGATSQCALYSGVTRTSDAQVRVRRPHDFQPGDTVIIQGVTGADAHLLNKQHTIGTVSSSGTSGLTPGGSAQTGDGNDRFTFDPPLDLSDLNLDFEAGVAVVGRVNIGSQCRSHGLNGRGAHGNDYCTFSVDALGDNSNVLLRHTQYENQLPGQPGELGIGNTGKGATFWTSAEQGGPVVATRKGFQYNEERVEQYMDNVLAFEYTVQSEGPYDTYDQTVAGLQGTTNQEHLTNDLDYKSAGALELNGGTIKRACASVYQVKAVSCDTQAQVELYGKHQLRAGDVVTLEGVGGTWSYTRQMNKQHIVQQVGSWAGISDNRTDWDQQWSATPPYGSSTSFIKLDLDTSSSLCGNFNVGAANTLVRLKNFVQNDDAKCPFSDALRTLPAPGDKMKGTYGMQQSNSYNKAQVVGRAYVQNVTSDNPDGRYGYNAGYGVTTGGASSEGVPDVIDIKVAFSEPVVASCGADNDGWATPQQYPGLRYRVCTSIDMVLKTLDNATTCTQSSCSENYNSTTGSPGESVFPTAFLYETGYDPPNVLNFRYVIRRNDNTDDLQYESEFALRVSCHRYASSGSCLEWSHIRRRSDNKLAGLRLPPTERDTGRCLTPTNAVGETLCTSTTADHAYSLAGLKNINIKASF